MPRKKTVTDEQNRSSSDEEIVPPTATSESAHADPEFSDEEMISLARFMANLKKGTYAASSSVAADDEPDEEMLQEFGDNRTEHYDSSDSKYSSSTSTDEFEESDEDVSDIMLMKKLKNKMLQNILWQMLL